jgi:mRNA-degrading endonuclease toxin of MazEF toxin-antitoxin module
VVVQNDVFNRSAIQTSVVNVSQILTVDKSELAEYSGNLSGAAAQAVRDGLHLLFDRL